MLAGCAVPGAVDAQQAGSGYVEHLLVWSWRRIATGRIECPVMAKEFIDACGEDAQEVFATFCTFLKTLALAARRRLNIQAPGWPDTTPDENQMLCLLAAAQAGDHPLFQAHLSWLTRPERRHRAQIAACAFATALEANDLLLSLPASRKPESHERPRAVPRAIAE